MNWLQKICQYDHAEEIDEILLNNGTAADIIAYMDKNRL